MTFLRRHPLLISWFLLFGIQALLQRVLAGTTLISTLLAPSDATPLVAALLAVTFLVSRFLALTVCPALVMGGLAYELVWWLTSRRILTTTEEANTTEPT